MHFLDHRMVKYRDDDGDASGDRVGKQTLRDDTFDMEKLFVLIMST